MLMNVFARLMIFISVVGSAPCIIAVADEIKECETFFLKRDYKQALPLCRLAAEQGDAVAQNALDYMYHTVLVTMTNAVFGGDSAPA